MIGIMIFSWDGKHSGAILNCGSVIICRLKGTNRLFCGFQGFLGRATPKTGQKFWWQIHQIHHKNSPNETQPDLHRQHHECYSAAVRTHQKNWPLFKWSIYQCTILPPKVKKPPKTYAKNPSKIYQFTPRMLRKFQLQLFTSPHFRFPFPVRFPHFFGGEKSHCASWVPSNP